MKMVNQEFYSLNDYRNDGRKREEIRDIKIKLGFDPKSDGSSMFQIGLT